MKNIVDKVSDVELRKIFFIHYNFKIKEECQNPDYDINKNNYHLFTKEGKQASRFFNYMTKVTDLISDLNKTLVFIRRFPSKEYYKSNDINQLNFIKYHFEVFIHKIHTLLEVKKLWLNDFYEIGLKEQNCNWENLMKYEKIQKSPASAIIKNYFKTFEQVIIHRHLNTHRTYFKNEKSNQLRAGLMIHHGYRTYDIDPENVFKSLRPEFMVVYQIKTYKKSQTRNNKRGN